MAYINMTKDFSNVKMNIPGLRITKRQLIAVTVAAIIGLPVFYVLRYKIGADLTIAVLGIMISGGPAAFIILFKKDNLGMEKHIKYFYESHFVRNTDRPYQVDNLYDLLQEEEKLKQEVEQIVFRGKSKEEINRIRASGESTEIRVGRKFVNKKIMIPLKGPIDKEVKKELEKAVKKAKIKGGIPESAQDTIPYKIPYEDGILSLRMDILRRRLCMRISIMSFWTMIQKISFLNDGVL